MLWWSLNLSMIFGLNLSQHPVPCGAHLRCGVSKQNSQVAGKIFTHSINGISHKMPLQVLIRICCCNTFFFFFIYWSRHTDITCVKTKHYKNVLFSYQIFSKINKNFYLVKQFDQCSTDNRNTKKLKVQKLIRGVFINNNRILVKLTISFQIKSFQKVGLLQ